LLLNYITINYSQIPFFSIKRVIVKIDIMHKSCFFQSKSVLVIFIFRDK